MKKRKSIECHNIRGGTTQLILLLAKDAETDHVAMQIYNAKDKEATPTYDFDPVATNEFIVSILDTAFIKTGYMNQDDLREVLNFIRGESYA